MAGQKTLAYVLGTRDYRDTSLLATFCTRDFGKVKAIIKGGRDARYRYGSTLEPFSLNEIIVYHRRRGDLHLVTAAELVERYEPVRRDLESLATATYFLELVDQLTDAGHSNEDVFDLLGEALTWLSRGASWRIGARIFEIKLMQRLGFMPELTECVRCGQAQQEAYFSIPSGGIVCSECRKGEGPLVFASQAALEFLGRAQAEPFAGLDTLKPDLETLDRIDKLMRQFVDSHLGYRPRSLSFMEKISAF